MTTGYVFLPVDGGSGSGIVSINGDSSSNQFIVAGAGISVSSTGGVTTVTNTARVLTNTHIFVGNASNVATDVAMSGDATIANTGAVTLKNTGTAGTYVKVTTDAQGRVTSGSASPQAIADGGTNSTTALGNGKVMVSLAGKIVEAPLAAYAASGTNVLVTAGTTTDVPLATKAFVGQTANLQEWRNSSNTPVAYISAEGLGNFSPESFSYQAIKFGVPGGIYSRFGLSDATLTSGNHAWRVNIDAYGAKDNPAKEAFGLVLDTETNSEYALYGFAVGQSYSNLLSIRQIGAIIGNSGSGTVYSAPDFLGRLTVYPATAAKVGHVVKGASSQTADLYQARDSTSAVLWAVGADGAMKSSVGQTLVAGSTSGDATFSQPHEGSSYKKVLIFCNALLGTASYTFPTAFTNQPSVFGSNDVSSSVVTAISTTAVTVTGATTTGFLVLEGY